MKEKIQSAIFWIIFIIFIAAYILLLGGCEYEQTYDLSYHADGVSDSVNIYYTDRNGEIQEVVDAELPWDMRIEDVDLTKEYLFCAFNKDHDGTIEIKMEIIDNKTWSDSCSNYCAAYTSNTIQPMN